MQKKLKLDRESIIQRIRDTLKDPLFARPGRLNLMLDLKLREDLMKDRTVVFSFSPKEWALNNYNGVHGGIIASVFDTGMGLSAHAACGKFVTTTDLTVDYLKPMIGKRFTLSVEYTHVGRKLISECGKITDDETGDLCAVCMASFMIIEKLPPGLQN